MEENNKTIWDVIVIGTGVSGLSAGMYCGRFSLKTLVIGNLPGGIITTTHMVENYPGIPSITGVDMGMVFLEHAQKFGAKIEYGVVTDVEKLPTGEFKVKKGNDEFVGRALIMATGTEYKKLGVPGEKELGGKGVSYCALCDAAFFKEKEVAIVGGGDSSAIEALILAERCKKVYMLIRKDVLRAEPVNYKKVMENPKIEVRFKTEITEIKGDGKVQSIMLKSGEEIKLDGVFIAIGHTALSELAKKLGCAVDSHNQIIINKNSETNVAGVFAAGDVCDTPFKQAITGAAEAVTASYFAYKFLQKGEVQE